MKLKSICSMLLILFLYACGPITMVRPTPGAALPDFAIQSAHISMVDENGDCIDTYVLLATLVNQGNGAAQNVILLETATGTAAQKQILGANEKFVVYFPLTPGGIYTIVADPDNSIIESDETNNSFSYIAPTPTPPVQCMPTPPIDVTPFPTIILPTSLIPSSLALEGLIYANLQTATIVKVFPGNHPVDLQHGTYAVFSPDSRFDVFESGGDLLLAEPMDNPGQNLTNTPETIERFPQWWASNPPKVVFTSIGVEEIQQRENTSAPTITGYLALMNTDGTDYAILSEIPSYTMPALSLDGKTIAFDEFGSPRLYEIGKGMLIFDPNQYGYQHGPYENEYYFSPSFSPDGHQLTWWVTQFEPVPNGSFTLVIFDLVNMTSRTLHSYTSPGGTPDWLPNPTWSPNGQWIAFQTQGETTPNDLWIMHQGGGIGQRFGLATNPVWSPGSQQLAYQQGAPRTSGQPSIISIVEVPSWVIEATSLPAGSIPLAWVTARGAGAIQTFPTYDIPDTWGTYSNSYRPYTVRYPPDAWLDVYPESLTIHAPFPPGTQMVNKYVRIETHISSEADCIGQQSWSNITRINGVDYKYQTGHFWDSTAGGRRYFLSQYSTYHSGLCLHVSLGVDLQDNSFATGGTSLPYPASPEQEVDDLVHILSTLQLQGE